MKKVVLALFAIAVLILVVACKPEPESVSYGSLSPAHEAGIYLLGDVNRIFSASQSRTVKLYETRTSRFYTGQEMVIYGHEVRFEGDIVEYNSIDPRILEYVESLESCNALMHQNYPMFEAGNIDPNKKYVEFSSYIDMDTGEALLHEIRIFQGDFMDTFNTGSFYAKAVTFSPDLTIDYYNNVNVLTGEPAYYYIEQGNVQLAPAAPRILQMREVNGRNAEFAYLGDVNRVFAWYDGESFDYIHMFGRDDFLAECYLVELNSLSANAESAFYGRNENGCHQREWTIVSVQGKEYVEVCHYTDGSDGSEWYEHRRRVRHMDNTTYGYYTQCVGNIAH